MLTSIGQKHVTRDNCNLGYSNTVFPRILKKSSFLGGGG